MIRGKPEFAGLPVLILTAKHITKDELSFLKGNNIHQFIQKEDISKSELLATVDEMVNPAHRPVEKRKPGTPRRLRSGKPLILIVEDNVDNMNSIKAMLQPENQVLEAYDGVEGVRQALKYVPDLILMDLSLPVLDGFSALEEIRKTENLKDIPVIAVTARAMKGNREKILDSGFDDYIANPVDEPLFRRVLKFYLEQKGPADGSSQM